MIDVTVGTGMLMVVEARRKGPWANSRKKKTPKTKKPEYKG